MLWGVGGVVVGGVVVGILLGGIGVVPIAFLASLFHGLWSYSRSDFTFGCDYIRDEIFRGLLDDEVRER